MPGKIHIGNAVDEGRGEHRGWFVGHFVDPASLAHSPDVEVKWGIHPRGEEKSLAAANETATTLTVLVSGAFRLDFPGLERSVLLERPGDYAMWGPGVLHHWQALEDTTILSIRWPSLPGDQRPG